jgi:hypothetical protein
MADDEGRFVRRVFKAERELVRPVFHSNAIYALSFGRDLAGPLVHTYKFTLDAAGGARDLQNLARGETRLNGCKYALATCSFRGRVYLFYDSELPGDKSKFQVCYKSAANPEDGWLPADGGGVGTGLTGGYVEWGLLGVVPGALAVKELGDKLYLFYLRDHYVRMAVYDGETWKELGPVHDQKYHPNFAVCAATWEGSPAILFGGFPHADDRSMYLTAIMPDLSVARPTHFYLDWAQYNNMVSLSHGSINDPTQANVLQVFCQNGGAFKPDLRRTTYNLETSARGEWFDSTIAGSPRVFCFCDVVSAAVPLDVDKGHFRQHLVVLSWFSGGGGELTIGSYPSDYFRCEHTSGTPIDTGSDQTLQPGAWTVLGVVEGVPPFTRNGVVSKDQTAVVDYGESTSNKVTIKQGFETAITAKIGAGTEKVFNVSAELSATFGVTNEMSKTLTRSVDISMANRDRNLDGSYGWLIVSRPFLRGRRYSRLSYDQSRSFGSFFVVSVEGVSVGIESYQLDQPLPGMAPRKPSAHLDYWRMTNFPDYRDVERHAINALTAELTGGTVKASLKLASVEKRTTKSTSKIKLEGSRNAALDLLFKVEGSAALSFSYEGEVTSEFTQYITASLKLLDPGPRDGKTVVALSVTPYWLVAKEGARLDPSRKPFWLADEYVSRGVIPWCLSWQVSRIVYSDGTELLCSAEPGARSMAAGE